MNPFLHIVIDEAFDLVAAGEAAFAKNWTGAVTNVMAAVDEVPALATSLPDAQAELAALIKDPSSDADLLAYVAAKFAGASSPASAGVARVILAAATMICNGVRDGLEVYNAVKALSAPAA